VNDASSSAAGGRRDAIMVWTLFLLALACFPLAALVVDSGRDFATGLAIVRGESFPAYGPSLNGLWQPGPAWFYLLAAMLAASGSIGGTALLVGILAAAKVPLAWRLGKALQGPALGLACAAAIALPGWSTLGQLVVSHTSLVETAVVATLLIALRAAQARSLPLACAAALMLGLAVHAHPTALVAAPAVMLAAWRLRRETRAWRFLPLALGAFLLPFAPMLVAETRAGWPQLEASGDYFGRADFGTRLARAPLVLWGATHGATAFVRELFAAWPGTRHLVGGTLLLVQLVALLGLLRGARSAPVRGSVALALLAGVFVLLLRDTTPAWMVYACAPFAALLVAIGWVEFVRRGEGRTSATTLAWISLALGALLLADRFRAAAAGLQPMPGAAIPDIAQAVKNQPPARFWLPAWGHDAVARRSCEATGPVAVHGDLAAALHFGQGVALALACGADHEVHVGGDAAFHVAGVPRALAAELGLVGTPTRFGHVLFERVEAIHPRTGSRVRPHTGYLMDDYASRTGRVSPTVLKLGIACRGRDLVVATNLLPGLNAPFTLRGLGGIALPVPVAETFATRYFACPVAGRLDLELEVLDPEAVDVFVLRVD
jgi:hypothetical protein